MENSRIPRIVIAGGGTGGHVLPAIAVIEEFQRRGQQAEFLWIGSTGGVEREEAGARGIPFRAIRTGKFRRYASLRTIPDAMRIPIGIFEAWRIIRSFRPDVVFSTGGFVSVPPVFAASRRCPIVTHEQTALIGLANRLNMRFADVLAVSFAETADRYGLSPDRSAITGNPVRASLFTSDPVSARKRLDLDESLPLLFITGGARGASPLNTRIEVILPQLLERCQIIHQTGPDATNGDFSRLQELRDTFAEPFRSRYRLTEFVRDELPDVYAAATLIVCRSGAGMIAELALLGKPSILIPLPGSGGGEQALNAKVLGERNGALVLDQESATPERLLSEISALLDSPSRLAEMGARAATAASPDAAGKLADVILDLVARSTSGRRA